MAHKPNTIKIVFQYERTEGISERYPVCNQSYYITADEAEIMVERDYQQRKHEAENPAAVSRRSVHDIFKELGNLDYNNAKKHLRNTWFEAAPRNFAEDDQAEQVSIVETASDDIYEPSDEWDAEIQYRDFLTSLDQVDRAIVIGKRMGYCQSDIARRVGISQPAVAKRLKKLSKDFQEKLA